MCAATAAVLPRGVEGSFMPAEDEPHEGTWLAWPHAHTYGRSHRKSLDPIWVAMTKALVTSENVHVVAYDRREVRRIKQLLSAANVPQDSVDFAIQQTDDVWFVGTSQRTPRDVPPPCTHVNAI
eukprot:m.217274 g.217274  ORF g.217274 m.217274 type:complete len:124 (-) comp18666_c1_seq2:890-1261(-)